jgi:2-methylcitrate dehydratase PrpD
MASSTPRSGLMRDHQLTLADIEEVRVNVGDFQQQLCEPIGSRRRPATSAGREVQHPVLRGSCADARRGEGAGFLRRGLRDPQVLSAADKVVPVIDRSFDWKARLPKGRLDILTRDGRTLSRVGDPVPGDAECPMEWSYLFEKFQDCASLAALPPAPDRIRKAQEMARHLEALGDATELVRVLA